MDGETAAIPAVAQGDWGPRRDCKRSSMALISGSGSGRGMGVGLSPANLRDQIFGLAHVQLLGENSGQGCGLALGSGQAQQSTGMAFSDGPIGKRLLDAGGQLEQAQGVGDGHPAFPDPGSDLLVRQAEIFS